MGYTAPRLSSLHPVVPGTWILLWGGHWISEQTHCSQSTCLSEQPESPRGLIHWEQTWGCPACQCPANWLTWLTYVNYLVKLHSGQKGWTDSPVGQAFTVQFHRAFPSGSLDMSRIRPHILLSLLGLSSPLPSILHMPGSLISLYKEMQSEEGEERWISHFQDKLSSIIHI